MAQIHKRFSDEQVRILLHGYCQGLLTRAAVQEMLAISKSSFFALLRAYRRDPAGFSVAYQRATPARLSAAIEAEVVEALCQEKELVEDKRWPISGYNYSAVRDRLAKKGIEVSLTTIIDRAKRLNCYRARAKRTVHDRELLTVAVGALIQHDGSTHQWAPLAQEKWVLITSIDDFSRKLLFADFFSVLG
jgi:transposase